MKILIETANGKIFKCSQCEAIHIEYRNLNFNFQKEDFRKFIQYVNSLGANETEKRNQQSIFSRKILMPVGNKCFNVIFNSIEFEEFKRMLNFQTDNNSFHGKIKTCQFEFTPNLN